MAVDLRDIVAVLPADNPVRKLIEYCRTELTLPADQTARTLQRAADLATGLTVLSEEGQPLRDEFRRWWDAYDAHQRARLQAMLDDL